MEFVICLGFGICYLGFHEMAFFYLLFLIFIILIFGTMAIAAYLAAPWVPTFRRDLKRMLDLAEIEPGETVFDLGCGDGRLVFLAAGQYHAQVVGFEISLLHYLIAKVILFFIKQRIGGRARIEFADFLTKDFSGADVILCFLTPKAMEKLSPKFRQELKKGARVVSYCFRIHDQKEVKISKPFPRANPIFLYRY